MCKIIIIVFSLDGQVIRMVGEGADSVGATVGPGSSNNNKMPTLEEYGTNLTKLAEEVIVLYDSAQLIQLFLLAMFNTLDYHFLLLNTCLIISTPRVIRSVQIVPIL